MSIPPAGLTMNTARFDARSTMISDVRFGRDVGGRRDENLLHWKILDRELENLLGELSRFLGGLRELHAAGLASSAGVNLRLDDYRRRRTFARLLPLRSGVVATSPGGIGMPYFRKISFA